MACFILVDSRVPSAFDSADGLFEVKLDGFRVLAIQDGGRAVCIPETAMTSAVAISTSRRHSRPYRPSDFC
jgi:hypothetical protein